MLYSELKENSFYKFDLECNQIPFSYYFVISNKSYYQWNNKYQKITLLGKNGICCWDTPNKEISNNVSEI